MKCIVEEELRWGYRSLTRIDHDFQWQIGIIGHWKTKSQHEIYRSKRKIAKFTTNLTVKEPNPRIRHQRSSQIYRKREYDPHKSSLRDSLRWTIVERCYEWEG